MSATENFIETYFAADPELISMRYLAQVAAGARKIGNELYNVLDGYDQVIDYLSKQPFEAAEYLHLNTVVEKVRWRKGKVKVTALKETDNKNKSKKSHARERIFQAKQIIITVPASVLKARSSKHGAISFDPEIPKLKILKNIQTNVVRRMTLVFSERFWDKLSSPKTLVPRFGIIHSRTCAIPHWNSQSPLISPCLIGWAGGAQAAKLPHNSNELRHVSLESISTIFKVPLAKLKRMLVGFYSNDWQRDPFSLGAYSYQTVGAQESMHLLNEATDDTVYFAGEAINSAPFAATVHGAIRSGYRAAENILSSRKSAK
jgi:monoamine oxidase